MIVRNNHDRHPRLADSTEGESEAFLAHAAGIEQVADNQQQVGLAAVGGLDHLVERAAHRIAASITCETRAERIGLEMNVRGMNKFERFCGSEGQADTLLAG